MSTLQTRIPFHEDDLELTQITHRYWANVGISGLTNVIFAGGRKVGSPVAKSKWWSNVGPTFAHSSVQRWKPTI